MNKVHDAAVRLEKLVLEASSALEGAGDEFSRRPAPGKWSNKEIIGHLIDSANNNHQRFVRGQFQQSPEIAYEQNEWVSCNRYQEMDAKLVIGLWKQYNLFLAEVMKRVPEGDYSKTCLTRGEKQTLGWLMADYVDHLSHHLQQVLSDSRKTTT
jgi:hypothetical protein